MKKLGFKIKEKTFSLPLSEIKEVSAMLKVTSLPLSPKFVKGVVSIKNRVFTVVDIEECVKPKAIIFARCQNQIYGILVDEILGLIEDDSLEELALEKYLAA